MFVYFIKLPAIHNQVNNIFNIVGLIGIVRNERVKGCFGPQIVIGCCLEGRIFHVVGWQIAQHLADKEKTVGFRFTRHVRYAANAVVRHGTA